MGYRMILSMDFYKKGVAKQHANSCIESCIALRSQKTPTTEQTAASVSADVQQRALRRNEAALLKVQRWEKGRKIFSGLLYREMHLLNNCSTLSTSQETAGTLQQYLLHRIY